MADIDVTFGTNAAAAATQIDRAVASTGKASVAQKTHAVVTRQGTLELTKATVAVKAKTAADAQALVVSKQTAAQQRTQFSKGAAFLGVGRAAAGASAVMGAAAGVGSLAAATLAMTGVGLAIGLLGGVVERWLSASSENAKHIESLTKKLGDLKDRNADSGIDAAGRFGGSIMAMNSVGGDTRELADEFAKKFGFAEASKAALEAFRMFPDKMAEAMAEANDASRLTGQPLSESMAALKGMPNSMIGNGRGAAGVAGQFFGRHISADQITAMRDRSEGDPESLDVRRIQGAQGRMDLLAVDQIASGAQKAIADFVKFKEETVNAEIELKDAVNENTKAQEATRKQLESMSQFQKASFGAGGY